MSGADVIRVLRGNIWLIVILLAVSAVVGYFTNSYLAKNHSRYTAVGYCEISLPVSVQNIRSGNSTLNQIDMNIEQRTQVQSMRSESLYSRVLQNQNSAIRQTDWFKSFGGNSTEMRQDLMKNFGVAAIAETRLISASMQYSKPEDAKVIVQEVVDEHLKQQSQVALNRQFDRSQILQTIKLRTEADLRAVQQDLRELNVRLSNQGISVLRDSVSPKSLELQATATNLREAQEKIATLKGQLDQINTALSAGQDPPMLVRIVDNDPDMQRLQSSLREVEATIASNDRFMKESPTYKSLERSRDSLQQRITELRKDMMTKMKVTVVEGMQSELTATTNTAQTLTQRFDQLKNEVGETANLVAQASALGTREAALRQQVKEVSDSLDELGGITSGSGASISWNSRPITPEIPTFPKLPVTMTMAISIGVALALLISFVKEAMDTTIRSPRDVSKVGGINMLGMIPHESDDPQSAGAKLALVIAEAPQSMTAEQLRQVRTRLQHSLSLDTMRSLMVTSANPDEGKTTVAANLAAGLALVGRQILLVDANFRRPELHKLFGIENSVGFSNVLSSPDQLASAGKATKIPNLTVLPSGPKPANTTEMLESVLLSDFIDKAMETYDHIIFDSGPLLFASETVAMAPRMDGVVTVVRARQSTRGVLGRVRDTLRQIKAEHLGVVINGVRAHGGGYYGRNIRMYYEYSANGNPPQT